MSVEQSNENGPPSSAGRLVTTQLCFHAAVCGHGCGVTFPFRAATSPEGIGITVVSGSDV